MSFPDGCNRACLVPLAGLLNHSPWPHVVRFSALDVPNGAAAAGQQGQSAAASAKGGALRLISFRPMAAGQQAFLSYGPLSNAKLLLFYGFAVPGNPFDTVDLELKLTGAAGKLLRGIGAKHHLRRGPLPDRLMAAMRGLAATLPELKALGKDAAAAAERLMAGPLSDACEARALQLLSGHLESLLKEAQAAKKGTGDATAASSAGSASDCLAHDFGGFLSIYVQGQIETLRYCLENCMLVRSQS